jgi:hypothetical protein
MGLISATRSLMAGPVPHSKTATNSPSLMQRIVIVLFWKAPTWPRRGQPARLREAQRAGIRRWERATRSRSGGRSETRRGFPSGPERHQAAGAKGDTRPSALARTATRVAGDYPRRAKGSGPFIRTVQGKTQGPPRYVLRVTVATSPAALPTRAPPSGPRHRPGQGSIAESATGASA